MVIIRNWPQGENISPTFLQRHSLHLQKPYHSLLSKEEMASHMQSVACNPFLLALAFGYPHAPLPSPMQKTPKRRSGDQKVFLPGRHVWLGESYPLLGCSQQEMGDWSDWMTMESSLQCRPTRRWLLPPAGSLNVCLCTSPTLVMPHTLRDYKAERGP